MNKMFFINFALLILATVCVSAEAQTPLDLLNICQQYGGYYRESDCRCFYQCNHIRVWRMCCADGQAFDDRKKVCVPNNKIVCQSTQTVVTVRQNINAYNNRCYVPNSMFRHEDCGKYWHCHYRQWFEMSCPEGTLWNDDLKICALPQFSTCNTFALNQMQANVFLKLPNSMPIPKNPIHNTPTDPLRTVGSQHIQPNNDKQMDKHLDEILDKNKWLSSATYLTLDQNGKVIYGITKVSKFAANSFSVGPNNKTTVTQSLTTTRKYDENYKKSTISDYITVRHTDSSTTETPVPSTTISSLGKDYSKSETTTQSTLFETTDRNLNLNENIDLYLNQNESIVNTTNNSNTGDENTISTDVTLTTTLPSALVTTDLYNIGNIDANSDSTTEISINSNENTTLSESLELQTQSPEQSLTELNTELKVSDMTAITTEYYKQSTEKSNESTNAFDNYETTSPVVDNTTTSTTIQLPNLSTIKGNEEISESTTELIKSPENYNFKELVTESDLRAETVLNTNFESPTQTSSDSLKLESLSLMSDSKDIITTESSQESLIGTTETVENISITTQTESVTQFTETPNECTQQLVTENNDKNTELFTEFDSNTKPFESTEDSLNSVKEITESTIESDSSTQSIESLNVSSGGTDETSQLETTEYSNKFEEFSTESNLSTETNILSTTESPQDLSISTTTKSVENSIENFTQFSETLNESTTQSESTESSVKIITDNEVTETVLNTKFDSITEPNVEHIENYKELVTEESFVNITDRELNEVTEGLLDICCTRISTDLQTTTLSPNDENSSYSSTQIWITGIENENSVINTTKNSENSILTNDSIALIGNNNLVDLTAKEPVVITAESITINTTLGTEVNSSTDGNEMTTTIGRDETSKETITPIQPKINYEICKEVGGVYADEFDCKCFYVCDLAFRPYHHCCPDGLLFNESADDLLCDYPNNVFCRNGSNLPHRR